MSKHVLVAIAGVLLISGPAVAQGRECGRLHRDYESADGPKAWAAGPSGCGYATSRSAVSLEDARRRAMRECINASGSGGGCRILEAER